MRKARFSMLQIHQPPWLHAKITRVLNETALVVYRSVLVQDGDPIYSGVAAYIRENKFELVRKGRFLDAKLMYGNGEVSLHVGVASRDSQDWAGVDLHELRMEAVTKDDDSSLKTA